jgi:Ulp1 protease family, C-terminal catalytic domain
MSTLYGYIENDYWQKKVSLPGHWLNEMELKLLSAFFLRNTEHKSVHVISPDLTVHMKTFFEVSQRIAKKEKQEKDEKKYKFYIQYFAQYVDTVRDLFEHKFLIFLYNPSHMHWMAIVVVIPSLLYNSFLKKKTENTCQTDNFCGFSVFDSMAMSEDDRPEAKAKGLIPTSNSKYRAEYGMHLFLNCCASYLYSRDKEETSEGKELTFSFEQPFGLWNSSDGTKEFPCFDYDFPSILCQHDGFNCGFACIANAFLHL